MQNVPDLLITFDYFKFRVAGVYLPDNEVLILIIADVTDDQTRIKTQLLSTKREFVKLFGSQPNFAMNDRDIANLNEITETLQKGLFPKISFVGYSGVGKTTLTNLMLGAEIPHDHIPTITGTINMIQIGSIYLNVWDEAGQEEFQFVWSRLLQGSDLVFIVTDSSTENVEKSIYFVDLAKKEAPLARVAIIANKQDLLGAITPLEIKQKLGGIRTFSMVASDPASRQKIFSIVSDILEILPEENSPSNILLKRDHLREVLNIAISNKDSAKVVQLCKELERIYDTLGDEGTAEDYRLKVTQFQAQLPEVNRQVTPVVPTSEAAHMISKDIKQNHITLTNEDKPNLAPNFDASGTISLIETPKLVPTPVSKLQVYEKLWNLSLKKIDLDKHLQALETQVFQGTLSKDAYISFKQKANLMVQDIDKEIAQYRELLQNFKSS